MLAKNSACKTHLRSRSGCQKRKEKKSKFLLWCWHQICQEQRDPILCMGAFTFYVDNILVTFDPSLPPVDSLYTEAYVSTSVNIWKTPPSSLST